MKKIYSHKDTLVLKKTHDVTKAGSRNCKENTISSHLSKRLSRIALAVAAVVSGMLCSSGAVANVTYSPLPNPVSGTISGNYYVSMGPNDNPRDVSEEIKYDNNLKLCGNIDGQSAQGAVDGKTFNISSEFNYTSSYSPTMQLYAGYSTGNSDVTNNTLNFSGFTSGNKQPGEFYLYGGYSLGGKADRNKVSITGTGGSVNTSGGSIFVYGGYSAYGVASNNSVTISGDTLASSSAHIYVYGGYSDSGSANDNSVNISGGELSASGNPLYVQGGYSNSGSAESNSVTISGGKLSSTGSNNSLGVFGGQSYSGSATKNKVTISGGELSSANGAVNVSGGRGSGDTTYNSVTISGGTLSSVNASVCVNGGYSDSGSANENKVYLTGGTFNGNVEVFGGKSNNAASNNKIYVAGNINLDKASLNGGDKDYILSTPTITDNMLIFGFDGKAWAPGNYTINSVNNFSTIRFDNATWGKTITVNTFANASTDSTVTKIDASKVAFSGVDALSKGDSYDMLTIKTISSDSSIELASTSSTYTLGTTLQGTGTVSISDTNDDDKNDTVTYTIDSAEKVVPSGDSSSGGDSSSDNTPAFDPQPQTHGVSMVNAAVTTALTQGADTASVAISNLSNSGSLGVQSFSSVGGGASRSETGSHVSAYGLNFSVGAGNNIKTDSGLLSFGGAFEAGYGKFKNSYNAGDAEPYIGKKGHYSYYGVALMGNYAFENLYHVNAALRVGKIRGSQNNALYNANTRQTYDFDTSQTYFGVELGAGKVIKFTDIHSLDIYAKYFYLHQGSDSFNAGGLYHIHALDSHRLRIAGRYQYNHTARTVLYAGVGGEYEFNAKSKVTLDYGVPAKASDCKGFRGYGEVGVIIKPEGNKGFNFDLGVKGHYGAKYRDLFANVEIKYYF